MNNVRYPDGYPPNYGQYPPTMVQSQPLMQSQPVYTPPQPPVYTLNPTTTVIPPYGQPQMSMYGQQAPTYYSTTYYYPYQYQMPQQTIYSQPMIIPSPVQTMVASPVMTQIMPSPVQTMMATPTMTQFVPQTVTSVITNNSTPVKPVTIIKPNLGDYVTTTTTTVYNYE